MKRNTWEIGTRLHHAAGGFATVVETGSGYANTQWWKIRRDSDSVVIKCDTNDRRGWHLVNSKNATSCIRCQYAEIVDPEA